MKRWTAREIALEVVKSGIHDEFVRASEVEWLRGALAEKHRQIVNAASHENPRERLRALDELTEVDA